MADICNACGEEHRATATANALFLWLQRFMWLMPPEILNDNISTPTWGEKAKEVLDEYRKTHPSVV